MRLIDLRYHCVYCLEPLNGSTIGLEQYGLAVCSNAHLEVFSEEILSDMRYYGDSPSIDLRKCRHSYSHNSDEQKRISGYLDGEPCIITHPTLLKCYINVRRIESIICRNFGHRFKINNFLHDGHKSLHLLLNINVEQQEQINMLKSEISELKNIIGDFMNLVKVSTNEQS